jgi:hypothetical protein
MSSSTDSPDWDYLLALGIVPSISVTHFDGNAGGAWNEYAWGSIFDENIRSMIRFGFHSLAWLTPADLQEGKERLRHTGRLLITVRDTMAYCH